MNRSRSWFTTHPHPTPQLLADVTQALLMALGNVRLRARIRTGVVELSLARRRLVEAADSQRRRLQAELAEGPGKRFDEVTRILQRAQTRAELDLAKDLQAMISEVAETQTALRELAEGVRPPCFKPAACTPHCPRSFHMRDLPRST